MKKNGTIQSFKSECFKFLNNKVIVIIFSAVVVACILLTLLSFNFQYEKSKNNDKAYPTVPITQEDRAVKLDVYKSLLEHNKQLLKQYLEVNAFKSEIDKVREEIVLYEFYTSTETVPEDYININFLGNVRTNYYGPAYLFFSMGYLAFALMLFTLIVSVIVFTSEYTNGSIKNIISMPIKRSQIILGKFLFMLAFSLAIMLAIVLVCVIIAAIYGLNFASIVISYPSKCINPSVYTIYISKIVGIFFAMVSIFSLTAFAGELTKSSIAAILIVIVTFGLLFVGHDLLFSYYRDMDMHGLYDIINYFFVFGLLAYLKGFDSTLGIIIAFHILLSVIFIAGTKARFSRRDI